MHLLFHYESRPGQAGLSRSRQNSASPSERITDCWRSKRPHGSGRGGGARSTFLGTGTETHVPEVSGVSLFLSLMFLKLASFQFLLDVPDPSDNEVALAARLTATTTTVVYKWCCNEGIWDSRLETC